MRKGGKLGVYAKKKKTWERKGNPAPWTTDTVEFKARKGWQRHDLHVEVEKAIARLAACPLESVRTRMAVKIVRGEPCVGYQKGGLFEVEEIECAKWILFSRVPDEAKVTEANAEAIFAWVRKTL